jgi:hypothetical protein
MVDFQDRLSPQIVKTGGIPMRQNRHDRRRLAAMSGPLPLVPRPLSHWLVMIIAFAALVVQSFVVQTHIHIPRASARPESVTLLTLVGSHTAVPASHTRNETSNPRDKYPIDEDPSNCPLCQEFAHSGQYVQSAAVLAYIAVWVSVRFVIFSEVWPSLSTVSHSWRGRAPPQS